jgi:hypothetical protein
MNAQERSSERGGATPRAALRRRLLQGSLSAPLVMTVTSAAGAGRTTFTACLDNARLQPKPHRVMARGYYGSDDWLRVQVDVYEVAFSDGNGRMVKVPGKYFVGPDKNTMFKLAEHRSEATPPTIATKFNIHTPGMQKQVVEKRFALAYADERGKVVGYGWQDNGGAHCKKSCFSSVIARVGERRRRA